MMYYYLLLVLSIFYSSSSVASTFNLEYKHVPNELIITYKSDVGFQEFIEDDDVKVVNTFKGINGRLIRYNPNIQDVSLYERALKLIQDPNVAHVEANVYYQLNALPDDLDFAKQYGVHNTGQTGGKKDADIDAPEAWDISTGSRNTLVGVIDTGIDYTHPDLAANMWINPKESGVDAEGNDKQTNGIDDDGNGYIDDYRGWDFINNDNDPMDDHNHGTHCAGVIGASGNNGLGIVGVNWEVSLVGLKIFDRAGSTTTAAIIEAIEYSTALGVDITSNSWGGGGFSDGIFNAIKRADDAGILFVAASGNSGKDADRSVNYPSGYELENIIAVAATDHNDQLAYYSNYGKMSVDVAAPGTDIYSTIQNGDYKLMSGTSMATPHVAGLAALIKSTYPDLNYLQIKRRIYNSVDVLDRLKAKLATGGRINAYKSMEHDTVAPNRIENIQVQEDINSLLITWDGAGDDLEQGSASGYEVRYLDRPIVSTADWKKAKRLSISYLENPTSSVKGRAENLPINLQGYLAIRAYDNVGNLSELSESISFTLLSSTIVYENTAESLEGVETDSWGIESIDDNLVFSDSPDAPYEENANNSLILTFETDTPNILLEYTTSYDLEYNYDFGFLEISIDKGKNWIEIAKYNGLGFNEKLAYNLTPYLNTVTEFKLRFRVKTDFTVTKDGWKIDNIRLLGGLNLI